MLLTKICLLQTKFQGWGRETHISNWTLWEWDGMNLWISSKYGLYTFIILNVAMQWFVVLFCILDVLGLNFHPLINYPVQNILRFSSVSQWKCCSNTLKQGIAASFIFPIHHSLPSSDSAVHNKHAVRKTILNKLINLL